MRIMLANKKSTIFAITVDITKIVLGKYTLVIKEAEPTKEADAELNEFENKFHGRSATKRKME